MKVQFLLRTLEHGILSLQNIFFCLQMEMRSQDQALIRQLMELHSGIQELKQELSEEEEEKETDDDDEEEEEAGSYWDSESERGSVYSSSGEAGFPPSYLMRPRSLHAGLLFRRRGFNRRSSVP